MEIVINTCYGGFGLSNFATEELLRRKGKECYWYKQTEYSFENNESKNVYVKVGTPSEHSSFGYHCVSKDHGDKTNKLENDFYVYFSGDKVRTDPDFIAMIKEFGAEKCNGTFAELKIVKIPDDVQWEIDDYDGIETIHEVHRSWY